MVRLSPVQERALASIRAAGEWYPGNGIGTHTVRALAHADLIDVEWYVTTWWNRRSGRNHSQLDWKATPRPLAESR